MFIVIPRSDSRITQGKKKSEWQKKEEEWKIESTGWEQLWVVSPNTERSFSSLSSSRHEERREQVASGAINEITHALASSSASHNMRRGQNGARILGSFHTGLSDFRHAWAQPANASLPVRAEEKRHWLGFSWREKKSIWLMCDFVPGRSTFFCSLINGSNFDHG